MECKEIILCDYNGIKVYIVLVFGLIKAIDIHPYQSIYLLIKTSEIKLIPN